MTIAPTRSEPRRSRARKLLRIAGLGLAALGAAAIALVVAYRFVQPPGTIVMVQRAAAGLDIDRRPVPLSAISPHLVMAVVAAEDSRFCAHRGFDREAIAAALAERRKGGRRRGASTVSQQTAKNVFLWTGGGWPRKGVEAGFTALGEIVWGKRRIMELYLNLAEWGEGLFGAEAAAQRRFGKPAADLTPGEAALLAAVLPNPNAWRVDPPGPYVRRRAATLRKRMEIVRRDGLAACVLEETR